MDKNRDLLGAPLPQQDWNMHPDTGVNPTGGRWGRRWKVKQKMLRKLSWNHTTTRGPWVSVHPHRISLTTLRSEGLIVQHQPMLMIKRPADHDKVNPQKATTAHMWTTTLLQATKRSARHRETWTKTKTSWVHPSHNKTETCTQTPVSTLVKLRHKPETGSHERQKQLVPRWGGRMPQKGEGGHTMPCTQFDTIGIVRTQVKNN